MHNTRSIKDLKNTTEISKLCHEINEPIFITKNGEKLLWGQALDIQYYDCLEWRVSFLEDRNSEKKDYLIKIPFWLSKEYEI